MITPPIVFHGRRQCFEEISIELCFKAIGVFSIQGLFLEKEGVVVRQILVGLRGAQRSMTQVLGLSPTGGILEAQGKKRPTPEETALSR
jgi:hypothetical protein